MIPTNKNDSQNESKMMVVVWSYLRIVHSNSVSFFSVSSLWWCYRMILTITKIPIWRERERALSLRRFPFCEHMQFLCQYSVNSSAIRSWWGKERQRERKKTCFKITHTNTYTTRVVHRFSFVCRKWMVFIYSWITGNDICPCNHSFRLWLLCCIDSEHCAQTNAQKRRDKHQQ